MIPGTHQIRLLVYCCCCGATCCGWCSACYPRCYQRPAAYEYEMIPGVQGLRIADGIPQAVSNRIFNFSTYTAALIVVPQYSSVPGCASQKNRHYYYCGDGHYSERCRNSAGNDTVETITGEHTIPYHAILIRTRDGTKNQVFPYVYTPHLVLITINMPPRNVT